MKITQKGYFRDFISDFGPSQKNSEKSPVSVKKTRTHSKWVIDGCSHFFLLKHKDVNSGKMNPPEKNFLFGHLSFFYADFHQLNIKIFILTISYNHITGLRILFPVYTFHFLSSSCVCSSEGLPAIWGLPVSVSTTLKVTLQTTSEVGRLSPGAYNFPADFPLSHPFPFFYENYFRTLSLRGGGVFAGKVVHLQV